MSNRFSNLNVPTRRASGLPTTITHDLRNVIRCSQWQRRAVLDRRLSRLALFLISFSLTLLLATVVAWAVLDYAPNIAFLWLFALLPLVVAGSAFLSLSA
jgi:hypothetical protein